MSDIWNVEHHEDPGSDFDAPRDYYDISNGTLSFETDHEESAKWLCDHLNGAVTLPTREEVTQAVARAWCTPANAQKTMDVEIALAAVDEVFLLMRKT